MPGWDRSALRIADANLNRAVEGLRVAEDVCRFQHDARGLAGSLKRLRHTIHALASIWSSNARLAARDARGDVGRETAIEPPSDSGGLSTADLGARNLRRASEAVRVLEELARISDPRTARELERVRYEIYTIESALDVLAGGARRGGRLASARLCLLVTRALVAGDFESCVREALDAGVDIVQMREKSGSDRERLALARSLREWTARAGVLFFVNDRVDLAVLSRADGVHLGQDDLDVGAARRILAPEQLLGVSTHSLAEAEAAERDGVHLIGVGPMFPTTTKVVAAPRLGPLGLARVLEAVRVPAFAIGGIGVENLAALLAVGCRRIAVSSAVLRSERPGEVVRSLRRALEG